MKLTLQLTLDGLIRALRVRGHLLADGIRRRPPTADADEIAPDRANAVREERP